MSNDYQTVALQIEQAFARLSLPVSVGQILELPTIVDYELRPAGGVTVAQVKARRDDIALALHDQSALLRQNGHLGLQLRREPAQVVKGDKLIRELPDDKPYRALLGRAEDGSILTVNLASADAPHILICGTTGSGKSILAKTVITSLTLRNKPRDLLVCILDPKRSSAAFAQSIGAHVAGLAHEPDDAVRILAKCIRVMEKRTQPESPRIIVYCDEASDLCEDERVLSMLRRIATRGREPGIHLICVTQRPLASSIGPLVKANVPVRIGGRMLSAAESSTALLPGLGAQWLMGKGDFILAGAGRTVRFQAALPPSLPITTTTTTPPPAMTMELPADPGPEIRDAPQIDDAGAAEDVDVLERLRSASGELPGVTAWANTRYADRWAKPFAGDRTVWMRDKYQRAVTALSTKALSPQDGPQDA